MYQPKVYSFDKITDRLSLYQPRANLSGIPIGSKSHITGNEIEAGFAYTGPRVWGQSCESLTNGCINEKSFYEWGRFIKYDYDNDLWCLPLHQDNVNQDLPGGIYYKGRIDFYPNGIISSPYNDVDYPAYPIRYYIFSNGVYFNTEKETHERYPNSPSSPINISFSNTVWNIPGSVMISLQSGDSYHKGRTFVLKHMYDFYYSPYEEIFYLNWYINEPVRAVVYVS